MRANTAAGLLAAAVGLVLTTRRQTSLRSAGGIALGLTLALGLLTLAEYLLPVSLPIDTWLPYHHIAITPGRPSPQTSLGFVLLGAAALLAGQTKTRLATSADLMALALVAFLLVMLGGHLYHALDLVGVDDTNLMAPHTLLCFVALAFVVVARRAKQGRLLAVLVNVGIGSRMVRMILPLAIVMPFAVFGAEAYLSQTGAVTAPYGRAIAAAGAAFLIACITTWMGWRINALERDLRDLSLTDELTAVYNRRGFYFFGQQAVRESGQDDAQVCLFFFDLDGLKHTNDRYGHEAGSALIQDFATILNATFRKTDIVGRVGGDEFAVLTQHDCGVSATELLKRLDRRTAEFNATRAGFPLSFSVGLVEMSRGAGETLDDLIIRGDEMMYRDKARKKAGSAQYERAGS